MMKFYCNTCRKKFDAPGRKEEFISPVYGPCSHYVADCPDCGKESNEFHTPKASRPEQAPEVPSCGMGRCCCGM